MSSTFNSYISRKIQSLYSVDYNDQVIRSRYLVEIVRHVVDETNTQPNLLQKFLTILQYVPTLLSHKCDTLTTRRNVLHALVHDIAKMQ